MSKEKRRKEDNEESERRGKHEGEKREREKSRERGHDGDKSGKEHRDSPKSQSRKRTPGNCWQVQQCLRRPNLKWCNFP
uniref:Uncharacterized protein n=1 Tax=Romanomermis culicivorax TaxID=13658 RepID=A0A915IV21_ROMCU